MSTVEAFTTPEPAELAVPQRRRMSGLRGQPLPVKIGGAILVLMALLALLAPVIAPYGQNELDFNNLLSGPSFQHFFGTDESGRDIFSRTLYALRVDLAIVVFVTYIPLPIGVLVGAIGGYFGGWVDAVISRVTDVMIAFPFFVLVIAVIAIVGPGVKGMLIGVPIAAWALYARLARSEMLVLREQQFMLATTALGYSRRRAIFRHAVPNLMRSALIYSTIDMVVNLLLLASLAYLGLGAQPPNAELGSIINEGQSSLLSAWWVATLPGLVIVLFGIAAGLVGDGLSDGRRR
ncbi:ABC transporter permease [Baekduia sp. Peel2402]|uniref:ABC transporter permease n=1 Tax=Baekduia sp. Peel2402 TaxID=3458296 RepID=UPI00403EE2E6